MRFKQKRKAPKLVLIEAAVIPDQLHLSIFTQVWIAVIPGDSTIDGLLLLVQFDELLRAQSLKVGADR